MIELAIEPPAVWATVSRLVTMRLGNPGSRALTNVVVGFDVPAELGLEQGRSRLELARLEGGAVHEHMLLVRPPHPGRFTIGVPNLSFRNGIGRAHRERDRSLDVVVEPPDPIAVGATDLESLTAGATPTEEGRSSIFLSYRRDDTKMLVAALAADLGRRKALRRIDVFLDIHDIQAGTDWSAVLDAELARCGLLVAVIGPSWSRRRGDDRGLGLHDPDDVVRREISVALQRGIPVLPLLVDVAMPHANDLPAELRGLTRLQAFALDLSDYTTSFAHLARRIEELIS